MKHSNLPGLNIYGVVPQTEYLWNRVKITHFARIVRPRLSEQPGIHYNVSGW